MFLVTKKKMLASLEHMASHLIDGEPDEVYSCAGGCALFGAIELLFQAGVISEIEFFDLVDLYGVSELIGDEEFYI